MVVCCALGWPPQVNQCVFADFPDETTYIIPNRYVLAWREASQPCLTGSSSIRHARSASRTGPQQQVYGAQLLLARVEV